MSEAEDDDPYAPRRQSDFVGQAEAEAALAAAEVHDPVAETRGARALAETFQQPPHQVVIVTATAGAAQGGLAPVPHGNGGALHQPDRQQVGVLPPLPERPPMSSTIGGLVQGSRPWTSR